MFKDLIQVKKTVTAFKRNEHPLFGKVMNRLGKGAFGETFDLDPLGDKVVKKFTNPYEGLKEV